MVRNHQHDMVTSNTTACRLAPHDSQKVVAMNLKWGHRRRSTKHSRPIPRDAELSVRAVGIAIYGGKGSYTRRLSLSPQTQCLLVMAPSLLHGVIPRHGPGELVAH